MINFVQFIFSGTSRQAIIKFITTNFDVDPADVSKRVSRFIVAHLNKGELKQATGKGAAGSFKLGDALKKEAKKAKEPVEKPFTKKAKAPKSKETSSATEAKVAKPKIVRASSKK